MKLRWILLVLLGLLSSAFADERGFDVVLKEMKTEPRVALVIGNKDYSSLNSLNNPINDARDMSEILRKKGFYVISLENASQWQMEQAITKFSNKIRTGKGVGLFYYAGHGVEVNGINYLIPSDARIPSIDFVKSKTVSVNSLLSAMENAKNRFNILILDACRSNPFGRGGGGLAPINNAIGVFVAYATAPGKIAEDGAGRNGLFTKYLKRYMNQRGLKIEEVFKSVGKEVQKESNRRQTPWTSSSVYGDFYFTLPKVESQPQLRPIILKPLEEIVSQFIPNFRVFSSIDSKRENPLSAKIAFENIGTWHRGMKFKKGTYTVTVSASNYETKRYSITINSNNRYDFELPFQISKYQTASSNSKWITPTKSICESNGGKIDKNGICKASWQNAKKVCFASGGALPSKKVLEQVVSDCGGRLFMSENQEERNKNKQNSVYQSCYKEKGFFASSHYWSSTLNAEYRLYRWTVSFFSGTRNNTNKYYSSYVRCVRAVE